MIDVSSEVMAAIHEHAAEAAPNECCGLVTLRKHHQMYVRCRNLAKGTDFEMHPDDYTAVADAGPVLAVVHSHCYVPATPSQADQVGCESTGVPWLIVNYPTQQHEWLLPSGYVAPLEGRTYTFKILDCYTLVRDYYERMFGITWATLPYEEEWWLNGKNHYVEGFESGGFIQVKEADMREHDVVLMQVTSPVPNHAGVLLADGTMLHHPYGGLSCRRPYGGYWRKHTTHVLRHKELM